MAHELDQAKRLKRVCPQPVIARIISNLEPKASQQ